jgi:hypothetical protein
VPPARWLTSIGTVAVLILTTTLAGVPRAHAQTWPEVKCARYQAAWSEALRRRGVGGLSSAFIASHDAFIASGCTNQGHVCPRSNAELDLANVMTIQAMNFGTASTFLPFACPR